MYRALVLSLILLGGCVHDRREAPTHETWSDLAGRQQDPLLPTENAATVLFFVAIDCPISNAYAPEVSRIVADHAGKRVAFFGVHCDPATSAEQAARHATEFGYRFPILLDPTQSLARQVGATTTPEAVVMNPRGEVAYIGRIDDLYYDFGKRRSVATVHDLRDAIDAVLASRPIARAKVPAVGCEIAPPEN